MDNPSLSKKEMTVIMSIMKNPEHADGERAGSIDMNPFTFNKIKNNLQRQGILKREYVPNYGSLGYEILVASFGSRLDPFLDDKAKRHLETSIMEKAPTHIVFFISEPGQGLGFHIVEDFTSMKGGLISGEKRLFELLGTHAGDMSMVPFSLRDIKVDSMFDLMSLVEATFHPGTEITRLDAKDSAQEAACLSWPEFFEAGSHGMEADLSEEENDVLIQIVSDPEGRKGMKTSRYRFRRIRERLLERRLLKPLVIPDPLRIGFKVLSFCHIRFKPGKDPWDLDNAGKLDHPSNLIMTVRDSQDAICIGLYPDLDESSRAVNRLIATLGGMNVIVGAPHVQVFSLTSSIARWPLNFANPLVQKGNWEIPNDLEGIVKGITSRAPSG